MVAVIKTGSSIRRIVNYNEQKVREGIAECLSAVNYPKDLHLLTFENKLNRLIKQASLNENVNRNSVHISLNFDPSEKLSNDLLKDIADTYMEKIGFANQPYLVYQHHDAGHPHIHIVTTKVREDGRRIETQNIGRNQSEKARKEIELSFGLLKAEGSKRRQVYSLKPVNVQKVQYGKSETKRAITNVLDAVLNTYKYTSLPELNAVLQQYNVIADRGSDGSRIYQKNGLTYRIIDERGNKVGVPIKASDFYSKPTLKCLEAKFQQNETARQSNKPRIKNAIDLALLRNPNHSIESLMKSLAKEAIHTCLRQNETGVVYGITYVDHHTKCVFNGSDLGNAYSAKGIQQRCSKSQNLRNEGAVQKASRQVHPMELEGIKNRPITHSTKEGPANPGTVLNELFQPSEPNNYVPNELKKTNKKKRKRLSNKL